MTTTPFRLSTPGSAASGSSAAPSAGRAAPSSAEHARLEEDAKRSRWWRQWGAYLPQRQWGTVREDYSADGDCWGYFPHDHARSRVYRWGEDGLLGLCDRHGLLCFAPTFWNGKDPILKERFFGLSNAEGNHGEDVKECYWFLDATPTGSYLKALYKYPQRAYPYDEIVATNKSRSRQDPEYELVDSGIFDEDRYFDVFVEYAKASPADILIRLTIWNRGPDPAPLHVLPTLWFRNTWSWGRNTDGYWPKPSIEWLDESTLVATHAALGTYWLHVDRRPDGTPWPLLFTENETNNERIFGKPNDTPYVKDAFHEHLVGGRADAINGGGIGTKVAAHIETTIAPGAKVELRLRLRGASDGTASTMLAQPFAPEFESLFAQRVAECEQFHAARTPPHLPDAERSVCRQAYAGLQWSKQFYCYVVKEWLEGDPGHPPPPPSRRLGRNNDWPHFFSRDVLSMPDTWEYPWFAAWDLAFQLIAMAHVDPGFAKEQLVLFQREWYQHPDGQLPAYEFTFDDANPPVHAWACWRVYRISAAKAGGKRDRVFLERCFQKLLLGFSWWINRRDPAGRNLFGGGFLGLDNVGIFDRSAPLPPGVTLYQSDGTAWMGAYCLVMLAMSLELAYESPAYEDMASTFFEHFVSIADAINNHGGTGLWDEHDGFYYDTVEVEGVFKPVRVRSVVGLLPMAANAVIDEAVLDRLPGFRRRMDWFVKNRRDLATSLTWCERCGDKQLMLALPSRARLERMLRYMLDESEFLSPYGIRSLSRYHKEHPVRLTRGGVTLGVDYEPGESTTGMFGGNSNWRGPIWFPVNDFLIYSLLRYHAFYGDTFTVECPTGSGNRMNLAQVAKELSRRLARLFVPGADGRRPGSGPEHKYGADAHWRDLLLFHEYFNGDTGAGLGASHQTGWTALVAPMIEELGPF